MLTTQGLTGLVISRILSLPHQQTWNSGAVGGWMDPSMETALDRGLHTEAALRQFMDGLRGKSPESVTRAYQRVQDRPIGRVFVPQMPSWQRVGAASQALALKHVDGELLRPRYQEGDVGGRWVEVHVWAPWSATTEEADQRFRERRCVGGVAAFASWLTHVQPYGSFVSIPDAHDPMVLRVGRRSALCYYGDILQDRRLVLRPAASDWGPCRIFVAFRSVSSREMRALT